MPYAPITAMLRSLVQQSDVGCRDAGPPVLVAAHSPYFCPNSATGRFQPRSAGAERLHEVVAVLLESFARDQPTVVVLLKTCTGSTVGTLTILRFLLRALTAGRIMFVLSYRSDDVPRGHPLRSFLTELERGPSREAHRTAATEPSRR